MKRFTVASFFCIAIALATNAGVYSAALSPIVKNVPGVVMTGQDTGAPLTPTANPSRQLPLTLGGTAIVMTGSDTGAPASAAPTLRTIPLTLTAPGIVMTGQDAGINVSAPARAIKP